MVAALLFSSCALFSQSSSIQPSSPTTIGSAYGQKLQVPGIPNAGKINDRFFRGAQPRSEGIPELKKLGITTVVDLRSEDKDTLDWERKAVEAQGMHFINISVGGFSAPTDDQVMQFLNLFLKDPDARIFVHCHYGEDRTGVFVASYRMALEKWAPPQALREMNSFGFHSTFQPAMKHFARDFSARLTMAPAYSSLKLTPSASPGSTPH
jgi:tyrosine-protein phosphatase SIW14